MGHGGQFQEGGGFDISTQLGRLESGTTSSPQGIVGDVDALFLNGTTDGRLGTLRTSCRLLSKL